jgi:transposase
MGKKDDVPYRKYTEQFKEQALALADSAGVAEAARRLGIARGTLNNWIVLRREAQPEPKGVIKAIKRGSSDLEAENVRLKRELASAKLDLEIVKKAAAYFARESR